jgi:hypothetical protein
MESQTVPHEEWKILYELMVRIKELAPWKFMQEDDIFGIQLPGTEMPGFVSVMGTLGEHLSIAVYLGAKGLDGFWKMQELGPRLTPEFVLQVPQIQASFEDREMITDEDRKVIKSLGLKFRGAQAWPQFRSYHPACLPWYIDKSEADLLICALEQVLEVAPRFKENPDILMPTDSDDDYLFRVKQKDAWEDTVLKVDTNIETSFSVKMNMNALLELKRKSPGRLVIEADLFMTDQTIQENRKERPYFPFLLMLAEHASGYILASKILAPFPTIENMMEEIPAMVVKILANDLVPKEIQVKSESLFNLLQPVASEAGFKLTKASHLRSIEHAKREMKHFFGAGF